MRMHTKVVALLAGAATTVAVAAPATAATPTGRKTVSVGVTKSHAVTATGQLRPGLVHLRNTSGRYVDVFGARSGRDDAARLVHDLHSKSHIAATLKDFSLLGTLSPHRDGYLPLAKGHYYLIDDEAKNVTASKVRKVTVGGSKVNAKAPSKVGAAVVEHDRSLYASRTLPGKGYVHFINHGNALSVVYLIGVGKSVSDATVRDFLASPSSKKVDSLKPSSFDFVGPESAGRSSYLPFAGHAGRYVLIELPISSSGKAGSMTKNTVRLAYVK